MDVLYKRLYLVFVRFARRNRHEDPEAFAQSVFMRALGSRYDDQGWSQETWLWSIARNLLTDYQRKRRPSLAAMAGPMVTVDRYPCESAHVRQAVRALPERWRIVLWLRFWEDRPTAEVARIMGISQGAVKILRYRAIAGLAQELGAAA